MTVINGTGAVIESIYVLIFILHAPKKEKAKILGLVTFVLAAFSSVALVSVFALHGKTRRYFCGFAAAIFSVIMYGSPLSIMVCIHFSDLIPALSSPVFLHRFPTKCADDSDQDEECGVHAFFPVIVCFLVWYILVCIWTTRKRPFCLCKPFIFHLISNYRPSN